MTNEELAIEIQNGKTEYLPVLWDQVCAWVKLRANKFIFTLGDNAKVEFDDLYNSGYIAMIQAVKYYEQTSENSTTFIGYFTHCLNAVFIDTAGFRTSKTRNDPLLKAISLSTPLKEGEEDTIEDAIADSVDIAEEVIDTIELQELHNDLEVALSRLEAAEEKVIRSYYYSGLNMQQIGKEMNITGAKVRVIKMSALRKLRSPKVRRDLEKYIDSRTDFYLRVGAKSQKSPVELLVLRREELRNRELNVNKL